jgi:DNA-binding NtrC family response regulator
MPEAEPIVFVVDDDPEVRISTARLIQSADVTVETFGSAQEFLSSQRRDAPACLVLDVRLPGLSGLDLQRALTDAHIHIPIIFISGHGNIPMSVQAMKAGADETRTRDLRRDRPNTRISLFLILQCFLYFTSFPLTPPLPGNYRSLLQNSP